MKIFPLGACGGAAPRCANLGPPYVSETVRARMSKFYTHLNRVSALFGNEIIFARGRAWGAALPIVNLGHLISQKLVELES